MDDVVVGYQDRSPTASTEEQSSKASTRRQKVAGGALALLGLGLAAAGVVAVFTTESDAGAAALLTVGALIVLFVSMGDRLESLRYGGFEIALRRKAEEFAGRGDFKTANLLKEAANALDERVTKVARSYEHARASMPAGDERTALMTRIINEAKRDAFEAGLDKEEVLSRLWTGSEGARVWALAVLEARPELATTRAVIDAVQRPDQMFDQFHALVLAERFISAPGTPRWTRERVVAAVKAHRDSGALGNDRDCLAAAERVLRHEREPRP
jgi:hypothetical protein